WVMGLAAALGIFGPWWVYGDNNPMTALGITAGVWVMLASIAGPVGVVGQRRKLTRASAGMHLAHAGVGLFTIGATVVSSFGLEADRAIAPGEPVTAAGYTFDLQSLEDGEGPNYRYLRGIVTVSEDGVPIATLQPEKRIYRRQESPMTEAGIDASLSRDVFVAMGDPLGDNKWSVRLQYKPLIRLIWIGCIVMALGGLLAMTDRRYRVAAKASEKEQKAGAAADPAAV
ncbi:MAG: cytochrome c-type biogenesis CcmF C-terminal domain-containing protein, partial [Pseudomonadota bacterium]